VVPLEERAHALRGRARVHVGQAAFARARQGVGHQVAAHAFTEEARQRVERADLGRARGLVGEQRADPRQVLALDERAEAGGENAVELLLAARRQVALARAPRDQVARGVEVVDAQLAHQDVALLREQRARAGVGEELVRQALERAHVHRRHARGEHRLDLAQERRAALVARRAGGEQLAQLAQVHERDALAVRAHDPAVAVEPHQLPDAQPQDGLAARGGEGERARDHEPDPERRLQSPPDRALEPRRGHRQHVRPPDQRLQRGALGREQDHVGLVARELLDHLEQHARIAAQLPRRRRDRERLAVKLLQVEALLGEGRRRRRRLRRTHARLTRSASPAARACSAAAGREGLRVRSRGSAKQ
jgi:hypothetical protein